VVAQVSDWFARWTEPPRLRSRHAALEHFQRNAAWFGIATSPFLRDWYRPLSEPVRGKPPLPRGAYPYFTYNVGHVEYRFTITETGDSAALNFVEYARKNRAHVTITEIQVGNLARVTITDKDPGFT